MAGEVRKRMIEGAVRLLATRGLQATSFNEVIELTRTPRGSIYHHFPEGKDQLVGEAITLAGETALGGLAGLDGETPEVITRHFLGLWRALLQHTSYRAGCSVVAVTVATDSPDLLQQSGAVFRAWQDRLATLFVKGGMSKAKARDFAATLVASSEGAVVISRAQQSGDTFELVAKQLVAQARAYSGDVASATVSSNAARASVRLSPKSSRS